MYALVYLAVVCVILFNFCHKTNITILVTCLDVSLTGSTLNAQFFYYVIFTRIEIL